MPICPRQNADLALLAEVERLRAVAEAARAFIDAKPVTKTIEFALIDAVEAWEEASDDPSTKLEDDPEWPHLAVWDNER